MDVILSAIPERRIHMIKKSPSQPSLPSHSVRRPPLLQQIISQIQNPASSTTRPAAQSSTPTHRTSYTTAHARQRLPTDTPPAGCAARRKPHAARYIMEKQSTAMTTDKMSSYQSFLLPPRKKLMPQKIGHPSAMWT